MVNRGLVLVSLGLAFVAMTGVARGQYASLDSTPVSADDSDRPCCPCTHALA